MSATVITRYRCTVEGADGARTEFEVREGQHVLAAMSARGLAEIPVGCRGGGCGVCRVLVLEGVFETLPMSRRHISEAEQAAGYALACRILPRSALVLRCAPREA
ncbi:MAG: 2Fe-2S iron-sulfur cluster binding domain-containing protein [Deltaproteobacteria bacterium]|nr:2Fe-2S iron-sulfur cluster binding domain-containing protein [Deltaproteobacteria bacterium]